MCNEIKKSAKQKCKNLSHKASACVDYGWLHSCYLNQEKKGEYWKNKSTSYTLHINVLHINTMMCISHVHILILKMTMVAWEFGVFLFIYIKLIPVQMF